MTPLERYRKLETRLKAIHVLEDIMLEEMDQTWWDLSISEQVQLKTEEPQCWPEDGPVNDQMAFARMRQFLEEKKPVCTSGVCD